MEQMNIGDFLEIPFKENPPPRKRAAKPATSSVTRETRRASNNKTDKQPLRLAVLETLGDSELTAREIAVEMHKRGLLPYPARAIIQPRITELVEAGELEAVGDKRDDVTDRKVAVYKVV